MSTAVIYFNSLEAGCVEILWTSIIYSEYFFYVSTFLLIQATLNLHCRIISLKSPHAEAMPIFIALCLLVLLL